MNQHPRYHIHTIIADSQARNPPIEHGNPLTFHIDPDKEDNKEEVRRVLMNIALEAFTITPDDPATHIAYASTFDGKMLVRTKRESRLIEITAYHQPRGLKRQLRDIPNLTLIDTD